MIDLPHTPAITTGDYTFMATREYYEDLIARIRAATAGDRVHLATMAYQPHIAYLSTLMDTLCDAAARGVRVTVQIDAYNFLVGNQRHLGPLWWHTALPQKMAAHFQRKYEAVQRLRTAGATVVITNPPLKRFTSPFSGRSHIKYSIINDIVYVGGINLSVHHLDCMVKMQDKHYANWLDALFMKRVDQPRTLEVLGSTDLRHQISGNSELLVDVGVADQSIIYDEALAAIDRATDWIIITCQYFPHGKTAEHLKRAFERGVKVYPIFNHHRVHTPPYNILQYWVTTRERQRMPKNFFDYQLTAHQTYLHAKILATEKEALIGSHNYVMEGVKFGTAEIALHNMTTEFSRAVSQLIVKETGLDDQPAFAFLKDIPER